MAISKFIFILLFISFSLSPDSVIQKWSPSFGKLSWSNAKTKCTEQKMRLPTLAELKKLYQEDKLESWKSEGNTYLTSDEISKDRAYYFTLLNGVSFSLSKGKEILVRCVW